MHLDRRDADGFERVEDGDAGVRICGGVYDDAVYSPVSALYRVDYGALVVGLEKLTLDAELGTARADVLYEVGVCASAVDLRLAYAEKVEVGAVYDEKAQLYHPVFKFFEHFVGETV